MMASARGDQHDGRQHDHVYRELEQGRVPDIGHESKRSAARRSAIVTIHAATSISEIGAT
jgi:hypothetical protein